MLNEGDKAPEIQLETDKGEQFDLAKQKGRKVVAYFYPRADTPGCTIEAKGRGTGVNFTRYSQGADEVQGEVRTWLHAIVRRR